MADYNVPVTFKKFSNTEHSVTFTLPGHTSQKPHLAIFDRVVPVVQGKGPRVPQVRVRVLRGVLNADGVLQATRISAEGIFKYPVGALASEIIEDMGILATISNDAEFQEDVAVELRIPL